LVIVLGCEIIGIVPNCCTEKDAALSHLLTVNRPVRNRSCLHENQADVAKLFFMLLNFYLIFLLARWGSVGSFSLGTKVPLNYFYRSVRVAIRRESASFRDREQRTPSCNVFDIKGHWR
jgi:hypothetical protein